MFCSSPSHAGRYGFVLAAVLWRMPFCSVGDEAGIAQCVGHVRDPAHELAVILRIVSGIADQIRDRAAVVKQVVFGMPVSTPPIDTVSARSDPGHAIEIIREPFEVGIGEPADISE